MDDRGSHLRQHEEHGFKTFVALVVLFAAVVVSALVGLVVFVVSLFG